MLLSKCPSLISVFSERSAMIIFRRFFSCIPLLLEEYSEVPIYFGVLVTPN